MLSCHLPNWEMGPLAEHFEAKEILVVHCSIKPQNRVDGIHPTNIKSSSSKEMIGLTLV